MFKRMLLGFDGSEGSRNALKCCAELAKANGATVHLVAIGMLPEYAETQGEVDADRERAESFYSKRLDEAESVLEGHGIAVEQHLAYGKPSDQILHVADAVEADLIILGVHPHCPIRRRLLGSTADKVVVFAKCSVLRRQVTAQLERWCGLTFDTDQSQGGDRCLSTAKQSASEST